LTELPSLSSPAGSGSAPTSAAKEMLVEQAARHKAKTPDARVFVYRNLVKALPWFTEVRELLQNKSRWDWFISYERLPLHKVLQVASSPCDEVQIPKIPVVLLLKDVEVL
jgi:hypothetical protein